MSYAIDWIPQRSCSWIRRCNSNDDVSCHCTLLGQVVFSCAACFGMCISTIFWEKPIARVAICDSSGWLTLLKLKKLTCSTVLYKLKQNICIPPNPFPLTRPVLVNTVFCFYSSPSHHFFFFFFSLFCFHPCSKLVSKRRKAHLRRLDRRWTLGGIVNRQQSRGEFIASYGTSHSGAPKATLQLQLSCFRTCIFGTLVVRGRSSRVQMWMLYTTAWGCLGARIRHPRSWRLVTKGSSAVWLFVLLGKLTSVVF